MPSFLRPLQLAMAVLTLSVPCLAHADTVLSITPGGNSAFSGTLSETIENQTFSGSFSVLSGGTTYTFDGTDVFQSGASPSVKYFYLAFKNSTNDQFVLSFDADPFLTVGNTAYYNVCSASHNCSDQTYSYFSAVVPSGSSDPALLAATYLGITTTTTVSATPEPSSIALVGTGLLGAVGAFRRRSK